MTPDLDRYLELGWHVLPCRRDDNKRALYSWDQASNDPVQIRDWAKQWPYANWQVLLGSSSNILAIDVDGPTGDAALTKLRHQFGGMPACPLVRSGSASAGRHLYFAYPASTRPLRNWTSLGTKLEARGARHTLSLPPSIHRTTGWPYEWVHAPWDAPWNGVLPAAPAWLVDLIVAPPPTTLTPLDTSKIRAPYALAAVHGEAARLAVCRANRNIELNASVFQLCRRFVDTGVVPLEVVAAPMLQAALAAGLERREALATIRSAARSPSP